MREREVSRDMIMNLLMRKIELEFLCNAQADDARGTGYTGGSWQVIN